MEREYSINPENPKEYLKNHSEPETLTPQEQLEWFEDAEFPIFENTRPPRESSDGSASFKQIYRDMEFDSVQKIAEPDSDFEQQKIKNYISALQKHKKKSFYPLGAFVRVDSFVIRKCGERVLGLTDFLPSGRYFLLLNGNADDAFDIINKIICVHNISSPDGIISLAHESGHAAIYESLDNEQRHLLKLASDRYRSRNFSQEDLAVILKYERDAWAWALKKLKPIIGQNDEEGIITRTQLTNIIHKVALKSYTDNIAKKIASIVKTAEDTEESI